MNKSKLKENSNRRQHTRLRKIPFFRNIFSSSLHWIFRILLCAIFFRRFVCFECSVQQFSNENIEWIAKIAARKKIIELFVRRSAHKKLRKKATKKKQSQQHQLSPTTDERIDEKCVYVRESACVPIRIIVYKPDYGLWREYISTNLELRNRPNRFWLFRHSAFGTQLAKQKEKNLQNKIVNCLLLFRKTWDHETKKGKNLRQNWNCMSIIIVAKKNQCRKSVWCKRIAIICSNSYIYNCALSMVMMNNWCGIPWKWNVFDLNGRKTVFLETRNILIIVANGLERHRFEFIVLICLTNFYRRYVRIIFYCVNCIGHEMCAWEKK